MVAAWSDEEAVAFPSRRDLAARYCPGSVRGPSATGTVGRLGVPTRPAIGSGCKTMDGLNRGES
jgi:hypothetical protein